MAGGEIDLQQELERRTLEFLADTAQRVDRREMTPYVGAQRLSALWGAVAGLVPHSTMDLIEEAQNALDARGEERARHFLKNGQALKLVYDPRSPKVTLLAQPGGKVVKTYDFDGEVEPWRKREETAQKAAAALVHSGYQEI